MNDSFSSWVTNKNARLPRTKANLQQKCYIETFLNDLYKYASHFDISGVNILTLKRVETLGLDKGKDTVNDEEFLERFFILAHTNDLCNHLSFNGKSSLDLVRATKKGCITDLIELKNGSNNLYHALYEVIFYYFLLCRTKNKIKDKENRKITVSGTLNLIVLLPQQLYDQPDRYNKDKKAFVDTMQKELDKLVKTTDPKPTIHITTIPKDHPFFCHNKAELIQAYKGENRALYEELINATSAIQFP